MGTVHSMTRTGVWSCVVAALLFGASTPAASVLARDLSPLALAGLLYLGAATAVMPWWLTRRPTRAALRQGAPMIAIAIVAGGAIGPALLVAGLVETPASTASLLLNSELVFTVLVAATLFREHLGRSMIAAALLVTVATTLLVWQPGVPFGWRSLLIVAACLCWGIDNGATARIDQVSPQHVTFLKGSVAGTVNLLLGLAVSGATGIDASSVAWALLVGAVGYGASITLWVRGAQQLGAARAQVIFATAPFIGAALSWVLLDEAVRALHLVAAMVAAAGVALSLRSAHEHTHRHDSMTHDHSHRHDDGHHAGSEHGHGHGPGHGHPVQGAHSHAHAHRPNEHSHPHVPDLHHQHRET